MSLPVMSLSMEEAAALSVRIEAAFDAGGEDAVLQVGMPNGKTFGECAAEDIREIGKAYSGLAARHALTPGGILARKFFNGVYLEMASARLGRVALRQAGDDVERAKLTLRRAMAADPVILTHLLECALDDEVGATISALKAKMSDPEHAGSGEAVADVLIDALPDGVASVHELENGRQFGNTDMRGVTNYEFAARCVLEQIRSAASRQADPARHAAEESRSAIQQSHRLLPHLAAAESDREIRAWARGDDGRPGATEIAFDLQDLVPSLPAPEIFDVRDMPGARQ